MDVFYDRKYNTKFNRNNKKIGSKRRVKGTVKKGRTVETFNIDHTFNVQSNHLKGDIYADNSTLGKENFVHNVNYSTNKRRRWETIENLKKDKKAAVFSQEGLNGWYDSLSKNSICLENVENFQRGKDKRRKTKNGKKEKRKEKRIEFRDVRKTVQKENQAEETSNEHLSKGAIRRESKFSKPRKNQRRKDKRSKAPQKNRNCITNNDIKRVNEANEFVVVQTRGKLEGTKGRGNRGPSPWWRLGIERCHHRKKRKSIKTEINHQIGEIKRRRK